MNDRYLERNVLESILDGSMKAIDLRLSLLQNITDNFSEERKIGEGGCGEVFKGILRNANVAVKRIKNSHTIDEKLFRREVNSLMNVNHQNVVRFLGFCSNTEHKAIDMTGSGEYIYAEDRERLLCFEYISNGSLDKYITDELRGLEWNTRYQIIKGICEGLHYLHNEKHIIHMDLKPANILLDDHMVPKITDFGLSRSDANSHTLSTNRFVSLGYCAPEYLLGGKTLVQSDMYSLGVIIIELVTGRKGAPDKNNVLRRWRQRWHKSAKHTPLQYQQVTKCIEIALSCMEKEPKDRPSIWHIIRDLNEIESTVGQTSPYLEEDMLGIEPLELHFPFELNKQISCSLQLTNETDDYIAFKIQTPSILQYWTQPNKAIVPPRSKCSINITLQAQEKALQVIQYDNEFILKSTKVKEGLTAEDITEDMFNKETGEVVDEVNLTVVYDMQPLHEEPQVDRSLESPSVSDSGNLKRREAEPMEVISKISFVSDLVDDMKPMVVTAAPCQLPQLVPGMFNQYYEQAKKGYKPHRISAPKGPEESSSDVSYEQTYKGSNIWISLGSTETELLDVHPLELRFSFEADERIDCPLNLINKTDHYVGYWIIPNCPERYLCTDSLNGALMPVSTHTVILTMEEQQQRPLNMDKFKILMITLESEHDLEGLMLSIGSEPNLDGNLLMRVEELGGEVHGAILTAFCQPSEAMSPMLISTGVNSVDVHSTKSWILTNDCGGRVSIWNYQTRAKLMEVKVREGGGLLYSLKHLLSMFLSAKFISRKQWFVCGDNFGYIHVYTCLTMNKVKKFKAHQNSCGINTLEVHPTHSFLLSSAEDCLIKLWDWDHDWVCSRTFKGHTAHVTQVKVNPKDTNTFVSADRGGTIKTWKISSSEPITTLEERGFVDYLFTDSDRQCVIIVSPAEGAMVCDLQTNKCVHTLYMQQRSKITAIACHPTLPILVTGSYDGAVRLWNSTTYRLEKMVLCMLGEVKDFGFIGSTKLVVGCDDGIEIREINLATLASQL